MSQGGFQRVNPLGEGFIRGPARILVAPVTAAYPTNLNGIVNLALSGYTTEVQTITITGTPTGGTFQLAFNSQVTAPIAWNATSATVTAALVALAAIGTGGVTITGGPGPATPYIVTFAGPNAQLAQPLITASGAGLTGGASPAVGVVRTTAGFGLYDPVGAWVELGSTRGGVRIARNNSETMIDIDQIQAAIIAIPDEWELTIETALAEATLENIQLAWEGGAINLDIAPTPDERHLGIGNPSSYTQRRVAVVHKKTIGAGANLVRAHVARITTKSPVNSALEFAKTGQNSTIPLTLRCFADPSVADPAFSMGEVIEQTVLG